MLGVNLLIICTAHNFINSMQLKVRNQTTYYACGLGLKTIELERKWYLINFVLRTKQSHSVEPLQGRIH